MSTLLRRFLRRAKRIVRPDCTLPHAFSQEGEDLILARVFESQRLGFYVDVGAHHPIRFSNTYLFYLRGWTGLNLDATPGSMAAFRKLRPRDINLEMAIAEEPGTLVFHMFNEPALNTFDPVLAKERDGKDHYRIIETRKIETKTLAWILTEYVYDKQLIDFLSVDVEGLDLAVLRSNDWQLFSPRYVLAEDFSVVSIEETLNSPIATFLRSVGYSLFAKTAHTQVFRQQKA